MLDKIPDKLISKRIINNWNPYSSNLINYNLVNQYCQRGFKKWVQSLENPLAIDWIEQLFTAQLTDINDTFKGLEKKLGSENFQHLLTETFKQGGQAIEINKKIKSIQGEIYAYYFLDDYEVKNLSKINKYGDWESENSIISVKSILDLDIQYQLIEREIRGLHFIEENSAIRNFNHVRLNAQAGIDDLFLQHICQFINQSLNSTLKHCINNINYCNNIHIEYFIPLFNNQNTYYGQVLINVINYLQHNERIVYIEISEYRFSEHPNSKHRIELIFRDYLGRPKVNYYITNETYSYYKVNKLNWEFLNQRISDNLKKFDSYANNPKIKKEFIGWINLSISPMHQFFIQSNRDLIGQKIKEIINNRSYRVFVCLIPQWGFDMKEPIIFDFKVQ